jgi:hypothetical protein
MRRRFVVMMKLKYDGSVVPVSIDVVNICLSILGAAGIALLRSTICRVPRAGGSGWRLWRIAGILFEHLTGTHLQFVPYRSAAPALHQTGMTAVKTGNPSSRSIKSLFAAI